MRIIRPKFLDVFKIIIQYWAEGKEITQHAIALELGYRETKHVWNHVKTLELIGVVQRKTHSHSHVEIIPNIEAQS